MPEKKLTPDEIATAEKSKRNSRRLNIFMSIIILFICLSVASRAFIWKTDAQKHLEKILPMQVEAQFFLKEIQRQQEHRLSMDNHYWNCENLTASAANPDAFKKIYFEIPSDARYEYTMTATDSTFEITATANLDDDPGLDVWTINHTSDKPEHVQDDARLDPIE